MRRILISERKIKKCVTFYPASLPLPNFGGEVLDRYLGSGTVVTFSLLNKSSKAFQAAASKSMTC